MGIVNGVPSDVPSAILTEECIIRLNDALLEGGCHRKCLERRPRLENVERRAIANSLLRALFRCIGVERWEIRQREDLPGGRLHHQRHSSDRLRLLHRPRERLLSKVLYLPIDGQGEARALTVGGGGSTLRQKL